MAALPVGTPFSSLCPALRLVGYFGLQRKQAERPEPPGPEPMPGSWNLPLGTKSRAVL